MYLPLLLKEYQTILNYLFEKGSQYFVAGYLHFAKDYLLHPAPRRGDKTAVREMAKQAAANTQYALRLSTGYLTLFQCTKIQQVVRRYS